MNTADFDKLFFSILQRRLLESRHLLWPVKTANSGGGAAAPVSEASARARASRLIGLCDRARGFAAALRHATPLAPREARVDDCDDRQRATGSSSSSSSSSDDDDDDDRDSDKQSGDDDDEDDIEAFLARQPRSKAAVAAQRQQHVHDLLEYAQSHVLPLCSGGSGPGLSPLGAQLEHLDVAATNFRVAALGPGARGKRRVLHVSAVTHTTTNHPKAVSPEPVAGSRVLLHCANVSVFDLPDLEWHSLQDAIAQRRSNRVLDSFVRSFEQEQRGGGGASGQFCFAVDDDSNKADEDADGSELVSELTNALGQLVFTE